MGRKYQVMSFGRENKKGGREKRGGDKEENVKE
jgi:hypothetical protein